MTTARGPQHSLGPGGEERPHALSYPKAIALFVVALGLGVYLVQLGGGQSGRHVAATSPAASRTATSSGAPTSSSAPTSSTSGAPSGGSSSPTTTIPPGETASPSVKVLVANASQTNGVAAAYTSELSSSGWGTLTPVTALTAEQTSSVYYAPGEQAAAQAIAARLGILASAVQPLGVTTPVGGTTGADVVVVIGDDLAAKAPGTAG